MRKKTMNLLVQLGVPVNLIGFHYICDAMEIYEKDETHLTSKICQLYSEIAQKHNASASNVERCIRNAFGKVSEGGNLNLLDDYRIPGQKPTNGNLLACLYLKLKEE